MEAAQTNLAKPGLRERKKQQTREKIEEVALKLFAERGYDETTLAEIADAADVSPRTIFSYFESKEDILFCEEPSLYDKLEQALDQRPPGTTTVDVLRELVAGFTAPDEQAVLRKKVIERTESLRLSARARAGSFEELIAKSIQRDLGSADSDDFRTVLITASVSAAFGELRERMQKGLVDPASHTEALAILDQVVEFLRGGLEALERP
jgi:AcrR family transcriptional regulator